MAKLIEWNSDKTRREVTIHELTKALLEKREETVNGDSEDEGRVQTRTPRLVLSVIGDSSSFVPKPWLTQVFQLGLIETARGAKDCLILYKGSEEKVSTLVWEAVDDFRVMNNPKAKKIPSNDKRKQPPTDDNFITLACLGLPGSNNRQAEVKESVAYKYYEIQDRSLKMYQECHADVLASIAKEYVPFVELSEEQLSMKVPVLVIVAEGDLQTIDHVVQVLKRDIPVLILQGSGKAADLIAECMEDTNSIEAKAPLLFGIYFQKNVFGDLKNQMDNIVKYRQFVNIINIAEENETQFAQAVVNSIIRAWAHGSENKNERVVKSARPREYIRKNLGSTEEKFNKLDQDLYNELSIEIAPKPALAHQDSTVTQNGVSHRGRNNSIHPGTTVTVKNMNMTGEVKEFMEHYQKTLTPASLPLYFYIAYQFIQEMPVDNKQEKTKNFQILLKQAMIADRVDYVKVLLQEENVEFDRQQFPNVYRQTVFCGCGNEGDCQHIWSILQGASTASTEKLLKHRKLRKLNEERPQEKKVKNYQKCIQAGRQLCQKFLHYPRKTYEKDYLEDVDKDKMKAKKIQKKESLENFEKEYLEAKKTQRKETYQDLLIWALFANRRELATLFWVKCDNQLLTAILACCVLKKMAGKAKRGKDQFLYNSIQEHSSIFEKRALDLQTKLYEEDPEVAMDLMLTEQTVWNITVSPLECAFDNAMLDFIAHSCAQRRLNKIWYKRIGASLGDFWTKGLFCGCRREDNDFLLRKFFYAPLTRFLTHYVIFIAAMVCYSAFLLIELSEYKGVESIKIYEWLIYVWLLGDILEEYRGVLPWNNDVIKSRFSKKNKDSKVLSQSVKYRITRYFYDFWNSLDFISYCITIAAILVRFLHESTTARTARRLYSLSLFTMYMRFLHALLMSRKLGPKIIMIKEMLKDLFRFIGILFVFMVGVGVLYHANMYPAHFDMWNRGGWTYWRIWKIIYIPYWQIYGELFLDKFEANSTTPCTTIESEWENNPDIERCNEYDWVLIVIAAFYLLISNLLLVNLVIALFSYRFEIVQANSERLWRYWRYAVVMDYRTRVPAPLNLIIRPFMSIAKCIKKCVMPKDKPPNKEDIDRMERLQYISANKCIRSS